MKKIIIITMALLLGLFIGVSSAVEVNLLGPNKYQRTTGKPNVFAGTFPGTLGTGKLIILNGEANGKNRVSSAIISVNGKQVLGPSNFNQQVYNIQVPVSLSENNSISVELRSGPGSYLTIQITEEIIADAAAVIGPAGGTITAAGSPINGTTVVIPPGILDHDLIITLDVSDISSVIPEGYVPAGRAVRLGPSGTSFSGEVFVTVPYDDSDNDGIVDYTYTPEDQVEVVLFDFPTHSLTHPTIISRDISANRVTFGVTHFSTAVPVVNDAARSDKNITVFVIDGMDVWGAFGSPFNDFGSFRSPGYLRPNILGLGLGLMAGDVISYSGLYSSDTTKAWDGNAYDTSLLVPDILSQLINLSREAKREGRKSAVITHSWGTVLGTLALLYLPAEYNPDLFITLSSPFGTENSFSVVPSMPVDYDLGNIITSFTNWQSADTMERMILPRREVTDFNFRWVNYWAGHDLISGPLLVSSCIDDHLDSSWSPQAARIVYTRGWHWLTALNDATDYPTDSVNLKNKIKAELTSLFRISPFIPWPMFRHDTNRTGRSPYEGPQSGQLLWQYTFDYSIISSPVIGRDGTIYVGKYGIGTLYAIKSDGSLKWQYAGFISWMNSTPALSPDENTIYAASGNGSFGEGLFAINTSDGSLKWFYQIPPTLSSPLVDSDGKIFIAADGLYCINPDGSLLWKNSQGGGTSSPALGISGNIIIGGDGVYSIDRNTGEIKWKVEIPESAIYMSSPAVDKDGTIYIGTAYGNGGGTLYSISSNGIVNWAIKLGSYIYSSPAIANDGTVYIGANSGNGTGTLYAVAPTGSIIWQYSSGVIDSSPAVDLNGMIYFAAEWDPGRGKIIALRSNGTVAWQYPSDDYIDGYIVSSPTISSDGRLYIGAHSGHLYAFGQISTSPWPMFGHDAQHTGQSPYVGPISPNPNLLWIYEFKEPYGSPPITITGIGGGPVIGLEGTIYIPGNYGGPMGILYAINSDGTLKWKANVDVAGSGSAAIGLDGTIYITRSNPFWGLNALIAVNKDSGQMIWYYSMTQQVGYPVVADDGTIYVGDKTGLYAINPDGTLKWKRDTATTYYGAFSSGAIGQGGNIITAAPSSSSNNYSSIYCLDKDTGVIKWTLDIPQTGSIFPMIDSTGAIYFWGPGSPYPSTLYSISSSGVISWQKQLSFYPTSLSIGQDGTFYFGASDAQGAGGLYALSSSGDLKWFYPTGVVVGPPTIGGDGTIYFGSGKYPERNPGDSRITALRPDGTLLWEYLPPPVEGAETFYPAIGSDGRLYISGCNSVYAIHD